MVTWLRKKTPYSFCLTFFREGFAGFVLLSLFLLQGCEPPKSPGGRAIPGESSKGITVENRSNTSLPGKVQAKMVSPQATATLPVVPEDKTAKAAPNPDAKPDDQKVLGTLDKIDLDGNAFELASAIIAANTNAFLNRLPKPVVQATPDTPDTVPNTPPVDPFEGIVLLGVIYNDKQPIALISEKDATSLKKAGDSIAGNTIKVLKVGHDQVILQQTGVSKEKRTLLLPNIVGYDSKNPDGKPGQQDATAPSSFPSMDTKSPLDNLSKLFENQPSQPSGADVKLQEPSPR